jgi:hypothetical protein
MKWSLMFNALLSVVIALLIHKVYLTQETVKQLGAKNDLLEQALIESQWDATDWHCTSMALVKQYGKISKNSLGYKFYTVNFTPYHSSVRKYGGLCGGGSFEIDTQAETTTFSASEMCFQDIVNPYRKPAAK